MASLEIFFELAFYLPQESLNIEKTYLSFDIYIIDELSTG